MKSFAAIALAVSLLGGCASQPESVPPAELKLENLLRQALDDDFVADREIVVSYVEIPPNMTMDRHWHPGEEFQYYLDGEVEIAIDGQPSIIGRPGEVGHVPYRAMHTAITGPEGARLLVFRVHTKDEPVRILEEGSATDR
jgi:quercetin dioxygenase-like cupin family protein